MMLEGGDSPEKRLAFAYLHAIAREPSESERATLLAVFTAAREHFDNDAEAVKQLLSFGESKRDESLDAVEHAAWTIVASSILNLDETLTRG